MSCYTGLNAALYVRAAAGDVPVALVGDLFEEVADVNMDSVVALADVTTRKNKGWRSNCPTLKDMTVEITAMYKGGDAQLDLLRTAYYTGGLVDVAILTSATGAYEGPVARFTVSRFGMEQPLEEGQRFPISLTINEFGAWISGTHTT